MAGHDSDGSVASPAVVAQPSVGGLVVRSDTQLSPFPEYHPSPVYAPDTVNAGIDGRRILHSIRRRWLPGLLTGLLLAPLVGVPTWFLLPKGYEAVVWLQMKPESGMLNANLAGGAYDQYRKTQMQLLKSPFVLNAALRRPGIADLPTIREQQSPSDWLAKNLIMSTPSESEVVTLKLRGPIAEDTAKILNAVTASYLDDIVNKDRAERLVKRDSLEKKYKENQSELRTRKETFNEMARTLGSLSNSEVVTQRGLLMDHLGTLRAEIVAIEGDLAKIDTEMAIAKGLEEDGSDADLPMDDFVESAIDRDATVIELKNRLRSLGEAISEQASRSARGMNEPSVKRLRDQYQAVASQLADLRRELRPQVSRQFEQAGSATATVSPAVLAVRRASLAKNLEVSKAEYDKLVADLLQIGKANADLELRRSEIDQLQQVTAQLGSMLEASSVDLNAPPRVRLLEEAAVPQYSGDLSRAILASLASVLAFAAGVGLTVGFDLLRDRVGYPEEIPQRVGMRLLGTLPRLRRGRGGRLTTDVSRFMEGIDTIRTLTLQAGREGAKLILVTSSGEHEGKTTLAAQLAASIARSGKRTLLIDGDLRHPSIHTILQIELGTGFAEVLRGELGTDEVIQPTEIDGLFAVTSGGYDSAAVVALSRPQLKTILGKYRDAFDHVIIDSAPAYELADPLLLGQHSDVAIVSAMLDQTRVPQLIGTIDRLRSVGVRVLGCVLQGVALGKARRDYSLARK